jgi:chromosome segregation ATPase
MMKNILIVIGCAVMLAGLISMGCDSRGKLLQERLDRTEKELEGVRANLEKTGRIADKVPDLEVRIKQNQEEMSKLKADADGAQQDRDKALAEKEEIAQKNKQLKEENTKFNTTVNTMRKDTEDAKRRTRELDSAMKSSSAENAKLNEAIKALQEENEELKKRISELENAPKGSGK